MFEGEEYSPYLSAEEEPLISSINPTRKKKSKNKRRFSDEQIKSLETMFESETRLEPRKKIQLAKELGLQPRQVAIWFQNKRARWKSKQLERDYSILRANYNNLASRFEALKKEKQALANQLQKMNELIEKPVKEEDQEGTKCESEEKARSSGHGLGVVSDEDSSINNKVEEYFGLEETEPIFISMVETGGGGEGSLTSQEDWGSLDSDGLFDQSNSGCQWWDFWA